MHSILESIIQQKHREVDLLKAKQAVFEQSTVHRQARKSLTRVLKKPGLSLIGEIKRQSPSKGYIGAIADPVVLLNQYLQGGVSAISVLTDEKYFAGSLNDLAQVTSHVHAMDIPVLRKDFIIDKLQIQESIVFGADVILLIVAVLKEKTEGLLHYARQLGLDVIVEVHDEHELAYAVDIGADMIGINNRDLNTFAENLETGLKLVRQIPDHIVKVAESAIKTPADIKKVKQAGFDAALVGEALVVSDKPCELIRAMSKA